MADQKGVSRRRLLQGTAIAALGVAATGTARSRSQEIQKFYNH
ncbi:MAG TPA: twin-arginine translocation signal domain-containing protein [Desulfosporosinus sp.]|nr:twin-arginine translocation signal domain-containing protein [Desulfosporosinus sp.]